MTYWKVEGHSLNGKRGYAIEVEADTADEARKELRLTVVDAVHKEFGGSPKGVAYLVDPRSIEVDNYK